MGFLEDWWNGKKTINPVALAWNSLPPEAKASYSSIPGLLAEMSPGASVRDAVEASGEIGHGLLNADPKQAGLGAAEMGMAILGLLPFGRTGKVADKAIKEAAKETTAPIRAYHGSPHNFDKFDISKIGTGEGAQAYGHGLYFAENPAVASSYRWIDAKEPAKMYWNGKEIDLLKLIDNAWPHLSDEARRATGPNRGLGPISAAMQNGMTPEQLKKTFNTSADHEIIDLLQKNFSVKLPGHGYEVGIYADPAKFLDWDKPLSKQTPEVQAALKSVPYAQIPGYQDVAPVGRVLEDARSSWMLQQGMDTRGQQYHRQNVSKDLAEAGVPGIKYLDQGSRSVGEGSRNYVVFDPATIEILRKYGLLPAAGGAALAPGLLGPAEEY